MLFQRTWLFLAQFSKAGKQNSLMCGTTWCFTSLLKLKFETFYQKSTGLSQEPLHQYLFVHILMHFSCRLQIWQWKFESSKCSSCSLDSTSTGRGLTQGKELTRVSGITFNWNHRIDSSQDYCNIQVHESLSYENILAVKKIKTIETKPFLSTEVLHEYYHQFFSYKVLSSVDSTSVMAWNVLSSEDNTSLIACSVLSSVDRTVIARNVLSLVDRSTDIAM